MSNRDSLRKFRCVKEWLGRANALLVAGQEPDQKRGVDIALFYAMMAAFFSLPLGTSLPTAFGILAASIWIISGKAVITLRCCVRQSWFWPVLFVVTLLWAGLFYSLDPWGLGFRFARKSHYWLYGLSLASLSFAKFPPQRFIQAFLAGLALNAGVGAMQLIGIFPRTAGWSTGIGRGYSTLSAYLVIGILMASHYFGTAPKPRSRLLWGFMTAFFFFHLIILEGRTGYLTLLVLSPIAVRHFFKETRMVKIVGACALLVVLMSASPFVRNRVALTLDQLKYHLNADPDRTWGKEYTVHQDRFYMWYGAVNIFLENPILGVGTGAYKTAMEQRGKPEWPDMDHPHNDFLHMATSFGVLGIIAFLWLFGGIIRSSWKQRHTPEGGFIFFSASVVLVSGLFNSQLVDAGMAFLLALTVGFQQWLPQFNSCDPG